jgi:glycosyltransferase 2 family protein
MPDLHKKQFSSRNVLSALLVLSIIAYIIYIIISYWNTIKSYPWTFRYPVLIASFLVSYLTFLAIPLIMQIMLRIFDFKASFCACYRIIYLSQLGKYVPGKVWNMIAQYYLGRQHGIPKKDITAVTLLQVIINNLAGLYLAVLSSLIIMNEKIFLFCLPFIVISPIIFFLISPDKLGRFFSLVYRIMKKEVITIDFSFNVRDLIPVFLLYFINWIFVGISVFLFIDSVYPLELSNLIYIISIVSISWLIAYLMIFTPAGLGAREGMMTLLLLPMMAAPIALTITILMRIWEIIVDLFAILIAVMISVGRKE